MNSNSKRAVWLLRACRLSATVALCLVVLCGGFARAQGQNPNRRSKLSIADGEARQTSDKFSIVGPNRQTTDKPSTEVATSETEIITIDDDKPVKSGEINNSKDAFCSLPVRAFIVGVAYYSHLDEKDDLETVEEDVDALKKRLLLSGVSAERITVLVNDKDPKKSPSKAVIESEFDKFLNSLQKDDVALVYLSGHGYREGYEDFFQPYDVVEQKRVETSVSISAMMKALGESRAALKWMIVDACRALASQTKSNPGYEKLFSIDESRIPNEIALWQSCSKGEYSFISPGNDNSDFTKALLEAIDLTSEKLVADFDGDNKLTLGEIWKYVSATTVGYGQGQHPFTSIDENDKKLGKLLNLPIFVLDVKTATDKDRALLDEFMTKVDQKIAYGNYDEAADDLRNQTRLRALSEFVREFEIRERIIENIKSSAPDVSTLNGVVFYDFPGYFKTSGLGTVVPPEKPVIPVAPEWRISAGGNMSRRHKDVDFNRVKFTFVPCEAGSIRFSDGFEIAAKKSYWITKTEVTIEQWKAIVGENDKNKGRLNDEPVAYVGWSDCQKFLNALNKLPAMEKKGLVATLPTEDQWEYACLSGRSNTKLRVNLNELSSIRGPRSTGDSKSVNDWGISDMIGNVAEWCEFNPDESNVDDEKRPIRGGGFRDDWTQFNGPINPYHLRKIRGVNEKSADVGFRFVIVVGD